LRIIDQVNLPVLRLQEIQYKSKYCKVIEA